MDVMLVVDMQVGLLNGLPKHDLQGVIDHLNRLGTTVRSRSGRVVWIQHSGPAGDDFEPGTPGWSFLPELDRQPDEVTIPKTLNDAFAGTGLAKLLDGLAPRRLLIGGWATDFCVDATVRSAASRDYDVIVVADGHTLSDRPHLDAPGVIRHHNWVWANLIARRSVCVRPAAELL
jgi:nicotinamidase-related amidase